MNNFLIKILFTGISLFYHPSSSILLARVQKKWNPLNIHGSFPYERKSMILWSKPVPNNSNVAKAYGKRSFWESSYEESLDENVASDISFSPRNIFSIVELNPEGKIWTLSPGLNTPLIILPA